MVSELRGSEFTVDAFKSIVEDTESRLPTLLLFLQSLLSVEFLHVNEDGSSQLLCSVEVKNEDDVKFTRALQKDLLNVCNESSLEAVREKLLAKFRE